MSRKPLFLDRDGVLNRDITPYVSKVEEFDVFPWTVEALTMLDRAGFDLYVISNQQGVALGITPPEELETMLEARQGPRSATEQEALRVLPEGDDGRRGAERPGRSEVLAQDRDVAKVDAVEHPDADHGAS